MKTTKTFRLLAVLLALMLAFGAMPALAVEINSGDYAAWTQSAVDDLYGRLMAAENYEDYIAIVETLSETARTAFFNALTEEQQAALEEHAIALTPASEPFKPIVRFTKVGPLLAAPASGARMMRAAAQNGGSSGSDSGIVLNKTAVKVEDGYKITLEAYATGSSTTTVSTEPVDIVLVLDVSGSMDDPMSTSTEYRAVYEPDNKKTYYILRNGKYEKVQKRDIFDGWYYGTWPGTTVYPKTSESDTNSGHVQFYEKVTSSTKKIDSLKSAVNGFIDNVAKQSPDSSIAIVKFAGDKRDRVVGNDTYQDGYWTYNYSQTVKKLTSVKNNTDTLKSAVNSLQPAGATRSDYGMELAQSIITGEESKNKKKVVIMFTDGAPTSQSSFENEVANSAISASKSIKDNDNATVYTIGIFEGADGTPVNNINNVSDKTNKTNKYMHLVSSNYKDATSMTNTGTATYPDGGKSYFLSAGSAGDLNNIFQQISQQVGGSTIELDSSSYIQDTVTPYFTMPAGTEDVKFFTMDCNGENSFDVATKTSAEGVTAEIEDNTLKVTGFDFSANWCGSHSGTYSGKKLIIEFTVKTRDGFLGGNNVPTNVGDTDGIYNSENTKIDRFVSPEVNVPIGTITVDVQDKNVYLTHDLTKEQMLADAVVTLNDCNGNPVSAFDYTKENYGLEEWQYKFVDIAVTLPVGQTALMEDSNYTLSASINYKDETNPTATDDTANINVFKPELTFKDNTVDYKSSIDNTAYKTDGADARYENDNLVSTKWIHTDETSTKMVAGEDGVTVLGTAPTLTKNYEPTAGVTDNIVTATGYVPVRVTVAIDERDVTNKTTFVHAVCVTGADNPCQWDNEKMKNGDPAFLLHVVNVVGDLKITKKGLNQLTYKDGTDWESAIFKVEGDDKTWYVAINGNGYGMGSVILTGLKVGSYTVTEVDSWTWRYGDQKQQITPVEGGKTTEVTFTNIHENKQWLGGDNYENNVFAPVN